MHPLRRSTVELFCRNGSGEDARQGSLFASTPSLIIRRFPASSCGEGARLEGGCYRVSNERVDTCPYQQLHRRSEHLPRGQCYGSPRNQLISKPASILARDSYDSAFSTTRVRRPHIKPFANAMISTSTEFFVRTVTTVSNSGDSLQSRPRSLCAASLRLRASPSHHFRKRSPRARSPRRCASSGKSQIF